MILEARFGEACPNQPTVTLAREETQERWIRNASGQAEGKDSARWMYSNSGVVGIAGRDGKRGIGVEGFTVEIPSIRERATCNMGHVLRQSVAGSTGFRSHTCNACGKASIKHQEYIYRCNTCNFDVCIQCFTEKDPAWWVSSKPCAELQQIQVDRRRQYYEVVED
jgi:hypothetical protein